MDGNLPYHSHGRDGHGQMDGKLPYHSHGGRDGHSAVEIEYIHILGSEMSPSMCNKLIDKIVIPLQEY